MLSRTVAVLHRVGKSDVLIHNVAHQTVKTTVRVTEVLIFKNKLKETTILTYTTRNYHQSCDRKRDRIEQSISRDLFPSVVLIMLKRTEVCNNQRSQWMQLQQNTRHQRV